MGVKATLSQRPVTSRTVLLPPEDDKERGTPPSPEVSDEFDLLSDKLRLTHPVLGWGCHHC